MSLILKLYLGSDKNPVFEMIQDSRVVGGGSLPQKVKDIDENADPVTYGVICVLMMIHNRGIAEKLRYEDKIEKLKIITPTKLVPSDDLKTTIDRFPLEIIQEVNPNIGNEK